MVLCWRTDYRSIVIKNFVFVLFASVLAFGQTNLSSPVTALPRGANPGSYVWRDTNNPPRTFTIGLSTLSTTQRWNLPLTGPSVDSCIIISSTGQISYLALADCMGSGGGGGSSPFSVDGDGNVTLTSGLTSVSSLLFYNRTAITGVTGVIVKDGPNQGVNYALQFQNNAGQLLGGFYQGGYVTTGDIYMTTDGTNQGVFTWAISGVSRFAAFMETDGSHWKIGDYDNGGIFTHTVMDIERATGISTFAQPVIFDDITVNGTCTGCGSGSLPVISTTDIVFDFTDPTAKLRFAIGNFTTGMTRQVSFQDADTRTAAVNFANIFTSPQAFSEDITMDSANILANGAVNLGTTANGLSNIYSLNVQATGALTIGPPFFTNYRLSIISGDLVMADTLNAPIIQFRTTPKTVTLYGDLYPSTTSTFSVGLSSGRWLKGWFTDLDVSGVCTGCSGTSGANTALSNLASVAVNADLLPGSTNARNIGSAALQYNNVFSNTLRSCDTGGSNCWGIQSVGGSGLAFFGPSGNRFFLAPNATSQIIGATASTNYPLQVVDTGGSPGINFMRNTATRSGSISSGSTVAFGVQEQGDGHVFDVFQSGNVEIGSTTDHSNKLDVHGNINATTGYKANGTFGATATYSVRKGDDSAACNLVFTFGLLTSSTC